MFAVTLALAVTTLCRIQIVPATYLSGADFMSNTKVARDSRGFYYAAPISMRGEVAMFDSTGAFVRVFGRSGGGPGEMRLLGAIRTAPGDTLLVIEDAGAVHIFDPDQKHVRRVRPPGVVSDATTAAGRIIAAMRPFFGPASPPLNEVDTDGITLAYYNTGPMPTRASGFAMYLAAWNGQVAAAHRTEHRVDRFAVGRTDPVATYRGDITWFPPWRTLPANRTGQGWIADVAHMSGMNIILLIAERIPNPRRFPPTTNASPPPDARESHIALVPENFITRRYLEIVDMSDGRLVARGALPVNRYFGGVLRGGYLYSLLETPTTMELLIHRIVVQC